MVEFSLNRDDRGTIWGLSCRGHAGFDDGDGLDLVCAAVSALTGALALGFTRILKVPHQVEGADGWFQLTLRSAHQEHVDFRAAQVLLATTALALQELVQHYPGFIRQSLGNEDSHE